MRKIIPLLAALTFTACGSAKPTPETPGLTVAAAAPEPRPEPPPPNAHVLIINGGGNPRINYRSHLRHVEKLHGLMLEAGIEPERITVMASDGSDRSEDLATRAAQPEEDFWRLKGTPLEPLLRVPTETIDSSIEGVTLEPAKRANIEHWFANVGSKLKAGDTLFLYVTDHGTRHGRDPLDNRITLWGKDEFITARQLKDLVATLDPDVRVVALMSQCYSGGFAELANAHLEGELPAGNACGYFASTADRPAYGCFPENEGVDDVGHAFEFMSALDETGRFTEAHASVLVSDDTPDVPLKTTDAFLAELLQRDAEAQGVHLDTRVDQLLKAAFQQPAQWEAETRLLDRIAQVSGSFSPRSLGELRELGKQLSAIHHQLELVTRAWRSALADANGSNLEAFIAQHPEWAERATPAAVARLAPDARRQLTRDLLGALNAFTERDRDKSERIRHLHERGEQARAASYRMQVRLAVVLRMRTVLMSIAGRTLLREPGLEAEQEAFERLADCEALSLPRLADGLPAGGAEPDPYPPFEEDIQLSRDALPGWMGIRFRDPPAPLEDQYDLPRGASLVALVYPDSPAQKAGLEVGDIVTGPPGKPFSSKNQIRAWTMLSEIGKPGTLEILRSNEKQQVTLVPAPFPLRWPSPPGPVKVGQTAPTVDFKAYRGPLKAQLRAGRKHLLFFWATWCGPCKAAIPELLDFERARGVPVIAVTDEGTETLDAFLAKWDKTFPNTIAMDPMRKAFVDYGVSGTPTFVLIDEQGKVVWHQVGYVPSRGLGIAGWTWDARPSPQR